MNDFNNSSQLSLKPSTSKITGHRKKNSIFLARPAKKFKDAINYSSFLNNSNWSRSGLEFWFLQGSGKNAVIAETSQETFCLMACGKLFALKGNIDWGHGR